LKQPAWRAAHRERQRMPLAEYGSCVS